MLFAGGVILLRYYALLGLFIYFGIILFAVTREKKNYNNYDYFFAGRSLPFWALAITFVASWWGAGSAISSADLAYDDGMGAFFYYGAPVLIATFLLILGAKSIRKIGYLTQGKMMEVRYSKAAAKMLAIMILIFMVFNAASQMVGIGNFFGTYLEIPYEWAVVGGTLIVLIYSIFGGFRAVVITDIIQFLFLTLSAICVFVVGLYFANGFTGIQDAALAVGKIEYMNIGAGASKYMTYVITFGCSWVIQANVWQRISAAKNDIDARKMAILSFALYVPLYLMVVITGMAGLAIFPQMPSGGIIPTLVKEYMHPILGAVVFVGIAAAIMSTMDSLINTGALTLIMDLNLGQKGGEHLGWSKIATLIITIIALVIALKIRSILEVSWIASDVITTGVFVPLVFGFIWRRGNSAGALGSMIWGLCYCTYNLLIGFNIPLPAFWERGSAIQIILGVGVSAILYFGISLLTQEKLEQADKFIRQAGLLGSMQIIKK